jgi:hypothetical protein
MMVSMLMMSMMMLMNDDDDVVAYNDIVVVSADDDDGGDDDEFDATDLATMIATSDGRFTVDVREVHRQYCSCYAPTKSGYGKLKGDHVTIAEMQPDGRKA